VFLLLLCNDRAVLGPWANTWVTNLFTGSVIAVLVMLSVILTASVLFPSITSTQILAVLGIGSIAALGAALLLLARQGREASPGASAEAAVADRKDWRMPALHRLPPARLTVLSRTGLIVLRGYLIVAAGLVLLRIAALISAGH